MRAVEMGRVRDGIVTVHFYDVRDAQRAAVEIRRQQGRIRAHYNAVVSAGNFDLVVDGGSVDDGEGTEPEVHDGTVFFGQGVEGEVGRVPMRFMLPMMGQDFEPGGRWVERRNRAVVPSYEAA
ncbi:hypothetical protein Vadar_027395 [Vaccinium darrowii]|uniref:Uncharacterized protein n=1 Tax=Vaccinium darrowii TaxID=229202 RepID=A0ACB7YS28_9ERIC|nr:hypothetical protein Vadar_027395 [Vaccinium darrowii]